MKIFPRYLCKIYFITLQSMIFSHSVEIGTFWFRIRLFIKVLRRIQKLLKKTNKEVYFMLAKFLDEQCYYGLWLHAFALLTKLGLQPRALYSTNTTLEKLFILIWCLLTGKTKYVRERRVYVSADSTSAGHHLPRRPLPCPYMETTQHARTVQHSYLDHLPPTHGHRLQSSVP